MPEPVTHEVVVSLDPAQAFAAFTTRIGEWWPLDRQGVFGDGTVAFEEEQLVERSGDQESVWGEVMQWDPGTALQLTWHPGNDVANATDIRVTFEETVDGTSVTLTHSGWERAQDPDAAAADYASTWPRVLGQFAALVEPT